MRPLVILLLTAYLLIAGLWSGAATPVGLVSDGAVAIVNSIPGPVLIGLAVLAYLRHRPNAPAGRTA
jgi:hypothetical protein